MLFPGIPIIRKGLYVKIAIINDSCNIPNYSYYMFKNIIGIIGS